MAPEDDADAEDAEARRIFREAMKGEGVVPLGEAGTPVRYEKRPPTESQRRRRSDAVREERPDWDYGVAQLQPNELVKWRGNGVSPEILRRFGHDHHDITATLDLHHKNVDEAKLAVSRFLTEQRQRGNRVVCIIHGRGAASKTPARIKSHVAHWLQRHSAVLAYKSAPRSEGGPGAVWVLLQVDQRRMRR